MKHTLRHIFLYRLQAVIKSDHYFAYLLFATYYTMIQLALWIKAKYSATVTATPHLKLCISTHTTLSSSEKKYPLLPLAVDWWLA